MSSKMLIDANHPEETRVAVMKGNRVEEFDFESENKKQLRGNIYLAKVTRVEPSLQAAFIEYGGNRHGFLAFSEIHPDYYQIPMADRQALLREEAEAVAEEDDDEPAPKSGRSRRRRSANPSDEADEVQAKGGRRRSRRRRSKGEEEPSEQEAEGDEDEAAAVAADTSDVSSDAEAADAEAGVAEDDRDASDAAGDPSDVVASSPDDADASNGDADPSDDGADPAEDGGTPRTMAADNERESVSEPADGAGEAEEKPKRRRTSRPRAKAKKDADEGSAEATAVANVETAEAVSAPATTEEEAPKPKRRRRTKKADEAAGAETQDAAPAAEEAEKGADAAKPKRRTRRSAKKVEPDEPSSTDQLEAKADAPVEAPAQNGKESEEAEEAKPKRARRSRAKKAPEKTPESAPEGDGDEGETAAEDEVLDDDEVESVGTDDALEEVPTRRVSRRNYKIQEVIKRRQIMLVQVVKEERGNKGAALTTYLSLAGRYSVLMPNTARGGGISRKITSAGDRKKLKEIASSLEVTPGMGVILRTAGASRTEQEITRDFEYLLRLWENVRTLTLKSTAPCLVYEEGSLIKRSIRDLYSKEMSEILVAGRAGYEEARDFLSMLEPGQGKNVKLYEGTAPLFAKMGVEAQLDHMLQPQVTLKSGGYLVINQTEALVAIDVNSGKSTRQHSIEETATQTNLEAADEVARQLRLRDLAGLIVIDFIDMDDRRNNRAVEKRMKDALKNDRARIQVGRISHFGLLEMSRQRMRASVLESATETCSTCQGLGYVRSPSSVSIHVLRSIEEQLIRSAKNNLTVKTRLATALYLLNNKRSSIDDLEERFGVTITIEADEGVGQSHLAIERGDVAQPRGRAERHVQVDSIHPEHEADDQGSTDELDAAAPDLEEAESVAAESGSEDGTSSSDDEQPRKRRRGRRGGKRSSDRAETADGEAADMTQAAAPGEDGADDEQTAVEANARDSRPRRRRRKRSEDVASGEDVGPQADPEVAAVAAVAESNGSDADAAPAVEADEPPRPARRPTARPRRRSAEQAIAETAVHANSDEVVLDGEQAAPAEVIGEAAEVETSPDEPPRPARRQTSRARKPNGSDDPVSPAEGDAEGGEKKNWLQRTFFS